MKERPILFSGPMVRAILDGRKTQTRRVVKPQPPADCYYAINGTGEKALCMALANADVPNHPWFVPPRASSADTFVRNPYGAPGDRLWVRETWRVYGYSGPQSNPCVTIQYAADESLIDFTGTGATQQATSTWRPSIHMPRWASRINLDVTDIRVERLQSISVADCAAEGVIPFRSVGCPCEDELEDPGPHLPGCPWSHPICDPEENDNGEYYRPSFAVLWDSINAKRGFSWRENPWVWVPGFKVAEARS